MELSKDTHLVILSDCSLTHGLGENKFVVVMNQYVVRLLTDSY